VVGFEVELVERVAVFVVGGPEADVDLVAIEGEPGETGRSRLGLGISQLIQAPTWGCPSSPAMVGFWGT